MKTTTGASMSTAERMQAFWLLAVLTVSGWTLWSGVLMYFGWIAEGAAGASAIGAVLAFAGCALPLLCPESWGRAALKI